MAGMLSPGLGALVIGWSNPTAVRTGSYVAFLVTLEPVASARCEVLIADLIPQVEQCSASNGTI
ncbi:hypothetical protein ACFQ3J_20990 [Paenibacillus provencensis]|uniref:Uncharacterized protein n=1 Tax=Paenibacillus provencensis TaxID=441151 RepID=A0ABW3PVC9_9BACL